MKPRPNRSGGFRPHPAPLQETRIEAPTLPGAFAYRAGGNAELRGGALNVGSKLVSQAGHAGTVM